MKKERERWRCVSEVLYPFYIDLCFCMRERECVGRILAALVLNPSLYRTQRSNCKREHLKVNFAVLLLIQNLAEPIDTASLCERGGKRRAL